MESINEQIKAHALASTDWKYYSRVKRWYTLQEKFAVYAYEGLLPTPIIEVDASGRLKADGAYYFEQDGMSLYGHIAMRDDLSALEEVVALIHNTVHLNSETNQEKASWYHSKKFISEMAKFGIKCDKSGVTTGFTPKFKQTMAAMEATAGMSDGSIEEMLKAFTPDTHEASDDVFDPSDVNTEPDPDAGKPINADEPEPEIVEVAFTANKNKAKGSKMLKWECDCDKPIVVRCAVILDATCNVCDIKFRLTDKNAPPEMLKKYGKGGITDYLTNYSVPLNDLPF